jgi:hypothetical protein
MRLMIGWRFASGMPLIVAAVAVAAQYSTDDHIQARDPENTGSAIERENI